MLSARRPGYARVHMIAASINPSDVITIRGAYSRTTFPFCPGFEGVGEVIDADRDGPVRPGQRVIALRAAGAWSSIRDVPAADCVIVPPDISDRHAATAFINPLTALAGTDRLALDGRLVVITAASSTIADHFAGMLRARGNPVVGVIRSWNSRVRRPSLWDVLVSTDDVGWEQQLAGSAGGARIVLDAVGGDIAGRVARAVSTGWIQVVSHGLLSGRMIDHQRLPQGVEISNLHLREIVHGASRAEVLRLFARSFDGIRAGVIATDAAAVYPFADIAGALAWDAANSGKVLLQGGDGHP
ncbi:MAG TPA: alcohol dehydrogenase catalytic domain-containing protein [Brevibacterium sp.]|nr:alcohol dehydrogenase catalytic domain-containing protein [Brevibacterium sp.]